MLLVTAGWSSTAFAAPTISVDPIGPVNMTARVLDPAVATQTFTITNTGTTQLDISAIAPSGNAAFTIPTPPTLPAHLTTGLSLQVTVQFNPSVSGAVTGSLDITSNDAGSPTNIELDGSGTNAIISAADLDFGTVNDGTTQSGNVLISNIGAAPKGPLTVTMGIITNGGTEIVFGNTGGCTGGSSCNFTQPFTVTNGTIAAPVVCAPGATASGTTTATITFVSDSDSDPSAHPIATVTCTAGHGVIGTNPAAPTPLAFGNVREGDSTSSTYHLTNTGNLTISNVTGVLDPTNVGYALDPTTPIPTTLAPGANIPLKIDFAPVAGADGGPATVTFSGTWGPANTPTSAVLDITGTGLPSQFTLSTATVDFGDLRFDTTPTKTFCIINNGAGPV
ncbi:MAG TPA: choice-of-anchor D domain-containing protein, partial [Kofleriaceae bacterium]|nr:choice-of-anchor D domain-containing protein [Kofleriaceae bacterium]